MSVRAPTATTYHQPTVTVRPSLRVPSPQMAKLLLQHGADVTQATDFFGRTALYELASQSNPHFLSEGFIQTFNRRPLDSQKEILSLRPSLVRKSKTLQECLRLFAHTVFTGVLYSTKSREVDFNGDVSIPTVGTTVSSRRSVERRCVAVPQTRAGFRRARGSCVPGQDVGSCGWKVGTAVCGFELSTCFAGGLTGRWGVGRGSVLFFVTSLSAHDRLCFGRAAILRGSGRVPG